MASREDVVLIQGSLDATVFRHEITECGHVLPCWTVTTHGLQAHGQRELVLTILRNREASAGVPPGVFLYLKSVLSLAKQVLANEVLVETAAEHGLAISRAEAVGLFRGRKLAECVAEIERRLGRSLPQDFVSQFRSRMADAFKLRLRPVDGALELVKSLSQRFCVASSGPREKIELSLSLTGLLPFFRGSIFSSYEVGTWKPEPGLFLHAARAMGVEATDCVVVEDSLLGIQAGIAAGMQVFAFQPHEADPRIPRNVAVIRHLLELRARLTGNAAEQRFAPDETSLRSAFAAEA